ncbi:hypothetical protein M440DRAFT_1037057 [Trichoderma longibrachiatum ATCC 18648]|uniref:Uncharacterized protein n=1 Tax=Trichoderma longibrachiatum ATCC 18648 TaxID=983965 RepID=A0A2T4C073_TRILO|nr:hypothetical protein M440DRAFT_1037057 [Trichoderma longibrachiatum ATCC 18648]
MMRQRPRCPASSQCQSPASAKSAWAAVLSTANAGVPSSTAFRQTAVSKPLSRTPIPLSRVFPSALPQWVHPSPAGQHAITDPW